MPPTERAATKPDASAPFDHSIEEWWDPKGPLAALHSMTPIRLDTILAQSAAHFGIDLRREEPLAGLRVLDIGCGGGLAAEPFCRLGASVMGLDPQESAVRAARQHARMAGLEIEYRAATVGSLAEEGRQFDLVLALEVVEHLESVPDFLEAAAAVLAQGGLIVFSTLNRTRRSLALAIVGAEWIFRWVPRGSHDWRKFIQPGELSDMLASAGLRAVYETGFIYRPLTGQWRTDERDLSVNYAMLAVPAPGSDASDP